MHPSPYRPGQRSAAIAVLAAFASLAPTSAARAAGPSDVYVGLTYGVAFAVVSDSDLCSTCTGDTRGALGLFGGLRVATLPVFSGWPVYAELGWQDVARTTDTYYSPALGGTRYTVTTSGYSVYAAAKLEMPVTDRFAFYGRLGFAHSSIDATTPGGPVRPAGISGSGNGTLFGVGLQYRFHPNWSVRAEFTSISNSSPKTDVGAGNVGLAYHF